MNAGVEKLIVVSVVGLVLASTLRIFTVPAVLEILLRFTVTRTFIKSKKEKNV